MALLLDVHELVHADEKIGQVKAQAHLQPSLVAAAVHFIVVQCQRKEHNEGAYCSPHDLKELDPFSLDLLLPPAHLLILEPGRLIVDVLHAQSAEIVRVGILSVEGLLILPLHRCSVVVHHHDECFNFYLSNYKL